MQVNSSEPSVQYPGRRAPLSLDSQARGRLRVRLPRRRAVLFRRSVRSGRLGRRDRAHAGARTSSGRHRGGHRRAAGTPAGAAARASTPARLLADKRTVAILTGQQAGLFGGPLFTLLKALTALKLAEQVSRDHHVPAVAVFWIDAEDHDWDEVRSCSVFDSELTPRTVSIPARPGADPSPVATIRLDDSVTAARSTSSNACSPTTEFRSGLLSGLRRAYVPGTGMAEAFGKLDRAGARRTRADCLRLLGSRVEAARQPGVRARAVERRARR